MDAFFTVLHGYRTTTANKPQIRRSKAVSRTSLAEAQYGTQWWQRRGEKSWCCQFSRDNGRFFLYDSERRQLSHSFFMDAWTNSFPYGGDVS